MELTTICSAAGVRERGVCAERRGMELTPTTRWWVPVTAACLVPLPMVAGPNGMRIMSPWCLPFHSCPPAQPLSNLECPPSRAIRFTSRKKAVWAVCDVATKEQPAAHDVVLTSRPNHR